ncbi:MAG: hypothetical protein DSY43_06160, partial [Gammaproteobacteria bacterium]
ADNAIGRTAASADTTANRKRVNLNITGKSGATTVVISLRNDDNNNTGAVEGTGASGGTIKTHQFYMTTKVGPVNVKAGDFYSTYGLGARSKGGSNNDALDISTEFGNTTVGIFTADNSLSAGTTEVYAATKIKGFDVTMDHNPNSEEGYTDFSVKGTVNGILVAAEKLSSKITNSDTTLIHIGGKASGVKWDVAHLKNGTAINDGNTKFAPLGSMLVGKSARGGTSTAVANTNDFSKITGLAVSTKVAGNTIKAIFTSLKTASTGTSPTTVVNDTVNGAELILTRAMSGGKLTVNLGNLSGSTNTDANTTNKGLRFDVKF